MSVTRAGRRVLSNVDLDLRIGEVVALVGPNGAGKSTLLAVLSGDISPASGTIQLDGRTLRDIPTAEQALIRAVLLQEHAVSFPFTVAEVVGMGRHAHSGARPRHRSGSRSGGASDEEVIDRCLSETDLEDLADRAVTALSGGERARAALARVLAQDTPVLLLDEPTASLDLRHQEQVLDVARRRARSGVAVLVVMHDLGLAAAHADRVVVLQGGEVRADGSPAEVLTAELLSDVYGLQVEVWPHPRTGHPVIMPRRSGVGSADGVVV